MSNTVNGNATIVRTNRGLTIGGTRLTIYSIMDCLKANWPLPEIREVYQLTEEQMAAVLAYLDQHREEVEAEYRQVVEQAEQTRQYWEEKNRAHFAQIKTTPIPPEKRALWEKLQAWKERISNS